MNPELHVIALGTTLPLNGLPANSVLDAHVIVVHEYTLTYRTNTLSESWKM
jgi:hypothetical protein